MPRPRTVRVPQEARDTVSAPADTAAARAAGVVETDTTPPPQLPRLPAAAGEGWNAGVWEWDRAALLASGALTLTDLLARIPGVTTVRYGLVGMPELASGLGGNAGRIELFLDGFALDPLGGPGLDLSRIQLAELESVRVRRGLGSLRIELETLSSWERAAYSRIEAGTGDYGTDLLRGLFLTPSFLGGSLGLAVERLASDGLGFREPAENFGIWTKWTLAGEGRGVQVEYRRASISREALDSYGPFEGERADLVLRGRIEPAPGLVAEAFAGRSTVEDVRADTLRLHDVGEQVGLRAAFRRAGLQAATSARWRRNYGLPGWDIELAAGGALGRILALDGTVRMVDWRDVAPAWSGGVRLQAGPFLGLRPLAEWYTGAGSAPFFTDSTGAPILTERTGYRVGAVLTRGGLELGAAGLEMDADSVRALGLISEPVGPHLYPGGRVRGWEVSARIPTPWPALSLEGWFTRWSSGEPWIYLPVESGLASLVFHATPLKSGNLELLARLDGRHRGAMLVPAAEGAAGGGAAPLLMVAPAVTTLDFYLQLRIKDVRAFLRWENLTRRRGIWDVPGRELAGQRIFYGVKWQFRN
ncbi:MAG TPA: TonB-dependent receptor plug domain-containing protein [Longimicrobiales bacterium]